MVRVLELFACEGGATMGLLATPGVTHVTSMELDPEHHAKHQARFRGSRRVRSVCADVTELSIPDLRRGQFDIIWASPPCQRRTVAGHFRSHSQRTSYVNMLPFVRDIARKLGVPYVMENTPRTNVVSGWDGRNRGHSHEDATEYVMRHGVLFTPVGHMGGIWGNKADVIGALGVPSRYANPATWSMQGLVESIPSEYARAVMTVTLECRGGD